LREERAAKVIGGNEVRADKGDDGADDGDGRKAEERNPHVPPPDLEFRVVNELRANPKRLDKEAGPSANSFANAKGCDLRALCGDTLK
jgi:hypothetical protein